MQHARKYISQARRAQAEFHCIHKSKSRVGRVVLQLDRYKRTKIRGAKYPLCNFQRVTCKKPRVIHLFYKIVPDQVFRQAKRVLTLAVETNSQCLNTTQNLMSIPHAQYASRKLHHTYQCSTVKLVA